MTRAAGTVIWLFHIPMSMFSPKREDYMPDDNSFGGRQSAATVIANGVRVEGDFSSQGDVLIEGEVHGNVTTSGMLSVGSVAHLKADVKAEKAIVAGTIEGNLTVGSHLDLKSTAHVMGDLTCETVSVESGATMNGRVMVGVKAQVPYAAKTDANARHEAKGGKAQGQKEDE
jgi:cytoskeletal protein CcmA (bactofilin family)